MSQADEFFAPESELLDKLCDEDSGALLPELFAARTQRYRFAHIHAECLPLAYLTICCEDLAHARRSSLFRMLFPSCSARPTQTCSIQPSHCFAASRAHPIPLSCRHSLQPNGSAFMSEHSHFRRSSRFIGTVCVSGIDAPNHALQRTRPARHGCNRGVLRAGSLSLGR